MPTTFGGEPIQKTYLCLCITLYLL
ncbi:hypothetical protein [Staphylococcus aureus]|nr:hypothetical protein [Staphylococcus aureus]